MAYAYFVVHQPNGVLPMQNGGVPSALYAWAFLLIAVLGAGSWSLDAMWRRRTAITEPAITEPAITEPAITEPAAKETVRTGSANA